MKEQPENLHTGAKKRPSEPGCHRSVAAHTTGDARLPEQTSYRTVSAHATGEITEKKSRFIGDIFPVTTEQEAQEQIERIRKQYHDARHHCHAFVLGTRGELSRSSDNGEPSGTAGRPILEVITGADLTNTLLVVTRYFGGTLLGTGGLVRAYTQAAQAALANAKIDTHLFGKPVSITVDYALSGNAEHYFRQNGIDAGKPVYEKDVRYDLFLPVADVDRVVNDLTNICNGNIDIHVGDPVFN